MDMFNIAISTLQYITLISVGVID